MPSQLSLPSQRLVCKHSATCPVHMASTLFPLHRFLQMQASRARLLSQADWHDRTNLVTLRSVRLLLNAGKQTCHAACEQHANEVDQRRSRLKISSLGDAIHEPQMLEGLQPEGSATERTTVAAAHAVLRPLIGTQISNRTAVTGAAKQPNEPGRHDQGQEPQLTAPEESCVIMTKPRSKTHNVVVVHPELVGECDPAKDVDAHSGPE